MNVIRLNTLIFILGIIFTSCCKKAKNHKPQTIDNIIKSDTLIIDIYKESEGPLKEKTINILAVGDIMLGSNYPNKFKLPNKNILDSTNQLLNSGDLLIGNLEGTLFDKGGIPKRCNDSSSCYVFRMPFSYGKYLKDAGFDFLSIANNHSGDFGNFGRKATMKSLEELKINYAGLENICDYSIKEKDGIKYGFIGAGHNIGLVSINKYDKIKSIISEIRKEVDIMIVMFHGGGEGSFYQHTFNKSEFYLDENRGNVIEFAHMCIDEGADIIIGSGPHVTRAVELYKNKFIAYSLGNFATYGNFSLRGPNGVSPILKLEVDKKGNFIKGLIIPTIQTKSIFGPYLDENKTVIKYIQNLTKEDFPEGILDISDDGEISKKKSIFEIF